ncbi:hypothetical protein [Streptomyces sp. enrichment culture]|uniref:hypothetical protein n=1 Tax=Streptomyces sp. enrichment culture TaxID=1795815 RepID=UPI003F54D1F6
MTITRYRKRPVEADTLQWTGDNEAELIAFTSNNFHALDDTDRENSDDPDATATVYDKLHSTWILVYTGQHIVRGVKGEYYPIAEDVLAETYEPAPSAPPEPAPAERDSRPRTHIRAMIEVLKEEPPEQLAQPAGLFISGMLTGLAASVQILDGGTAEQAMEAVPTRLEAAIGRAFLNGTLPSTPARTDPAGELRQIDALLQGLGVEGKLGARGMATLANTVRTMREELQTAETSKAALALLRKGEEPLPEGQHPATASPAQWLWLWNEATPAERLDRAERIITSSQEASACFLENHRARLAKLEDLQHRVSRTERERDGAYGERAHLVALLAAMTDGAVIAPAVDVAEPGWQIVYLTIGGRQASWHISPRDAGLFDDVEHVSADDPRAHWDGHSTEDKYARIRQHTRRLARRCGPACAEAHTYTGRCEGAHQADDSDTTAPDVVHPVTEPQTSSPHGVDE